MLAGDECPFADLGDEVADLHGGVHAEGLGVIGMDPRAEPAHTGLHFAGKPVGGYIGLGTVESAVVGLAPIAGYGLHFALELFADVDIEVRLYGEILHGEEDFRGPVRLLAGIVFHKPGGEAGFADKHGSMGMVRVAVAFVMGDDDLRAQAAYGFDDGTPVFGRILDEGIRKPEVQTFVNANKPGGAAGLLSAGLDRAAAAHLSAAEVDYPHTVTLVNAPDERAAAEDFGVVRVRHHTENIYSHDLSFPFAKFHCQMQNTRIVPRTQVHAHTHISNNSHTYPLKLRMMRTFRSSACSRVVQL